MAEKINSIRRTLRVLTYICRQKSGVRVAEIARAFDTSSPAIYNYLKSLQQEGFIFKDEISGRFRATYRVVELGVLVQGNNDLSEMVYPQLVRLSNTIDSSVHLAVQEGDLGVCISKVENSNAIPSITRVGMSFDLYPTALGKAILAFLPEADRAEYLARVDLLPYTDHTITDRKRLETELTTTRARGYSLDMQEHKTGLHAIGVPVFDHTEHVIASISTVVPPGVPEEYLEAIAAHLKETARETSSTLGRIHSGGVQPGEHQKDEDDDAGPDRRQTTPEPTQTRRKEK
ncbi:MAG: IclR family transcriptional regulator [Alkalispirochaeta sp.]